jgi:hypothetical protein
MKSSRSFSIRYQIVQNLFTMKSLSILVAVATSLISVSAIPTDSDIAPFGSTITLPRSDVLGGSLLVRSSPKKKDNWGNAIEKDRKKVTIRASKNDTDDVSDDFLWALKKANNGGLVRLKKGHKYVIGKKLDLTFLNDVYVNIEGELKVWKSLQEVDNNLHTSVHQRYQILAGQQLLLRFPEEHHILGLGRKVSLIEPPLVSNPADLAEGTSKFTARV